MVVKQNIFFHCLLPADTETVHKPQILILFYPEGRYPILSNTVLKEKGRRLQLYAKIINVVSITVTIGIMMTLVFRWLLDWRILIGDYF